MTRLMSDTNDVSRGPMMLTVKQAADATGKSKPTIMRAIQSGTISAAKDAHGVWKLDAAELDRVGFVSVSGIRLNEPPHRNNGASDTTTEVELLRRMLADKDGTIDDLRRRLDAEAEERRRVQTQLTALLTDQRVKASDVMVTPPPTSETIITPPPPAADPAPAATSASSTSVPVAPARSNAAPVVVKVRPPVKKPPAKEAGWFRRMMGGR
jgi:excisionase family DNA binding protein